MKLNFPPKVQEWIGDNTYRLDDVGMSDSKVLCFGNKVLKIEKQNEVMDNEYRMLNWLQERLPVPQILHREVIDGVGYLLMSRIPGKMICEEETMNLGEGLIDLLVQGIKMFWEVDTKGCPADFTLSKTLELARFRVEHNLCDTVNVEIGTYGADGFKDPQELLKWLQVNKPQEDLVLSHGDFCLPNLFSQDGKISGFIDVGRCGISDRYQDIALCYRSLCHNAEGYYGGKAYPQIDPQMLFSKLGVEPNQAKLRYYTLLDELF